MPYLRRRPTTVWKNFTKPQQFGPILSLFP